MILIAITVALLSSARCGRYGFIWNPRKRAIFCCRVMLCRQLSPQRMYMILMGKFYEKLEEMKMPFELNLPNTITLIQFCMIPLVMLFLLLPIQAEIWSQPFFAYWLPPPMSLDGHYARSLGLVTTLGKFLDPLADKLIIATLVCLQSMEMVAPLPWFWSLPENWW